MDPRILFVVAIVGFRIFQVVQSQNKKKSDGNAMADLSSKRAPMDFKDRLSRQRNKPQAAKHKRDREDPLDGMHGDVLDSTLTIDDIVS